MANLTLSLILSSLFLLVLSLQRVSSEFEFLQLILQWPVSYCKGRARLPVEEHCTFLPPGGNTFTIHGLRAGNDTRGLERNEACQTGNPFMEVTPSLFGNRENLYQRTVIMWPNLLDNSDAGRQRCWRYEWEKHGRCMEPDYLQPDYFAFAVRMAEKYNISKFLRDAGITPSDTTTYPTYMIRQAIQDGVDGIEGKDPTTGRSYGIRIRCHNSLRPHTRSATVQVELVEVAICFNQVLQIQDCPESQTMMVASNYAYPIRS